VREKQNRSSSRRPGAYGASGISARAFADFPNARLHSIRHDGQVTSGLTDWTPQLNPGNAPFARSGVPSFGEDPTP